MKKFFIIFAMAFGMFAMQSCKEANTDFIYDVTATAEGDVNFTWFNGGASIKGDAVVFQCNDTTKVKNETVVLLTDEAKAGAVAFEDALVSKDKAVADAANAVDELIKVNGVEGTYHLTIIGYVKYGPVVIAINEEYPKTAVATEEVAVVE